MQHLLTVLMNWASLHWVDLIELAGGGAALSLLLQTLLAKAHVDSKKLAYTLIHVFSIITAIGAYLLASLPTTDVPAVYAGVVILAQTWHRFVISPAYNKFLVPYLEYVAGQKTTAPSLAQPIASTPTPPPAEFSL